VLNISYNFMLIFRCVALVGEVSLYFNVADAKQIAKYKFTYSDQQNSKIRISSYLNNRSIN